MSTEITLKITKSPLFLVETKVPSPIRVHGNLLEGNSDNKSSITTKPSLNHENYPRLIVLGKIRFEDCTFICPLWKTI